MRKVVSHFKGVGGDSIESIPALRKKRGQAGQCKSMEESKAALKENRLYMG